MIMDSFSGVPHPCVCDISIYIYIQIRREVARIHKQSRSLVQFPNTYLFQVNVKCVSSRFNLLHQWLLEKLNKAKGKKETKNQSLPYPIIFQSSVMIKEIIYTMEKGKRKGTKIITGSISSIPSNFVNI